MKRQPSKRTGTGTHDDPIRYAKIQRDDPKRQTKLAEQRKEFEADAKAGRVVCLSDLMCNHGM